MKLGLLLLALSQLQQTNAIRPADYSPCGLNSFYVSCRLVGKSISLTEAKELLGPADELGMHSLKDLRNAAIAAGLYPVTARVSLAKLSAFPMPAIVHVYDPRRASQPDHFAVVLKVENGRVFLLDPPMPAYSLSAEDFNRVWSRNVLVFAHSSDDANRLDARMQGRFVFNRVMWAGIGLFVVISVLGLIRLCAVRSVRVTRRRLVLVIAATVVVALSLLGLRSPDRSEPRRICSILNPVQHLGELDPGDFVAKNSIRNDGDLPLSIQSVRSSCTCVSSIDRPDSISPGECQEIRVHLRIGNGQQQVRIMVLSNDPVSVRTATLLWRSRSRLVLDPVTIVNDAATADRKFEKPLRVMYSLGDKSVVPSLESFECACPGVEVRAAENGIPAERHPEIENADQAMGELILNLTVMPPSAGALVETVGTVILRQGKEVHHLPIFISVRFLGGPASPDVQGVVFSAPSATGLLDQQRQIHVSSSDSEITLKDVPEWLSFEIRRVQFGFQLQLEIKIPPPQPVVHHTIQVAAKSSPNRSIPILVHCITSHAAAKED